MKKKTLMDFKTDARVKFEKLSSVEKDEYIEFLISAHRDRFDRERFENGRPIKSFLEWEYTDCPVDIKDKPLIWICRFNNRIIGQLCVMPVEIKINGESRKGGWCQDLIFLPEFRNSAAGYFLVHYVINNLSGVLDMVMVAGTNKDSYRIFKIMGFTDLGFINRNVYFLSFKNISVKIFKIRILSLFFDITMSIFHWISCLLKLPKRIDKDIEITEKTDFDEGFEALWLSISNKFSCIVKRDLKTLFWRFRNQPGSNYKILVAKKGGELKGFVITKEKIIKTGKFKGLVVGEVSDILFSPEEKLIGLSLLNTVKTYFKNKKVDIIRCDMTSFKIQSVIRDAGFYNISSNNRFLIFLLNDAVNKEGEALQESNWHLTYADSDIELL